MIIEKPITSYKKWTGILFSQLDPSIENVIRVIGRPSRRSTEVEPYIKIVAPCDRVYVYQKPEDVPLENVNCECGDVRHKVIVWEQTNTVDICDL